MSQLGAPAATLRGSNIATGWEEQLESRMDVSSSAAVCIFIGHLEEARLGPQHTQ
jgi:hypothetical protein